MNSKILVCTHKDAYIPSLNCFLPIQVGKSLSSLDLPIQSDNTGENISEKNKNYCELTALYWAWKNLEDYEIIGLCHYRRYFDFRNASFLSKDKKIICENEFLKYDFNYDQENIQQILNEYDIILPKRITFPYSLTVDYNVNHIFEDLEVLKKTINKLTPEYFNDYINTMQLNNKLSPYNMFITKKNIFKDYAEWLFKILFEVENNIYISEYENQARVFGYMGERLLNIYCRNRGLKIKYLPILLINNELKDTNKLYHLLNNFRFNMCFNLIKKSHNSKI